MRERLQERYRVYTIGMHRTQASSRVPKKERIFTVCVRCVLCTRFLRPGALPPAAGAGAAATAATAAAGATTAGADAVAAAAPAGAGTEPPTPAAAKGVAARRKVSALA